MSKIEVNKEEFLDKHADYVNEINSIGSELTNDCDIGVIKNSSEVVNAFVLAYYECESVHTAMRPREKFWRYEG